MSWAETLSINKNPRVPLNIYNYRLFYELCKIINGGYGDESSGVVVIPEHMETIGVGEYTGWSMVSVVFPENTKNISTGAFASCQNLCNITMNDGIELIDNLAFQDCESLKIVNLPITVKSIGLNVFPSSVEHIFVPWGEGQVSGAPWGATNATIHYNQV